MTASPTTTWGPADWGPREDWTIPAQLEQRLAKSPDRPALSFGTDDPFTIAELDQRSHDLARRIAGLDVARGDHVLVMAANRIEAVDAWLAITRIGAIDVDLNTAYRRDPLVHAVNLSRASVLLTTSDLVERVGEIAERLEHLRHIVVLDDAPSDEYCGRIELLRATDLDGRDIPRHRVRREDQASVIFTSGTTGPAKGVMMSHAQCFAIAMETVGAVELTEDDVLYSFHPLFHMAGKFGQVLAGMISGARVVIDPTFDAATWLQRIRQTGATVTVGHGPMLEMVHARPRRDDDSDNCLRALIGAPLPAAIAEDFTRRFDLRGVETWGMTEVTCATWTSLHEPLRPGSAGRPVSGLVDVQVVDPGTDELLPTGQTGEIVVRPIEPWAISSGYLNMPERTVETWRNLWFHTGDAGFIDELGHLHMVDRLGDRIRRRAENISSYEIEVAAGSHPSVLECAAIAVPSGLDGDDDIKLYAVAAGPLDWDALFAHLVDRLPHHMVPRYYERIDMLPRTPTNKVQKGLLRQRADGNAWDYREAGLSIRSTRDEQSSNQTAGR